MLETIDAAFPSVGEPSFDTPEEAIDFSRTVGCARFDDGLNSCIGRLIVSAESISDKLVLHLDNCKTLAFQCTTHAVELIVADDMLCVPSNSNESDTLLVRLNGTEIHWKKGELVRALVGNRILRIQTGLTGVFLYVTHFGILAINPLINRRTNRPFLYWDASD